ncbi:MAG: FAD-dependent oxidoreductase [Ideonella sp.]|nr:FAD-dependent oxidoreductase [Ideonella sp.]
MRRSSRWLRAAHDAVFVATGATRVKRLAALDYALPGVLDGAAYLAACNAGAAPALGRELVVIGGGSAALDAARSARRQGHAVRVLALESRGRCRRSARRSTRRSKKAS